jgi:serine/threonine protein kinase
MDLEIGSIIGDYQVTGVLGAGGMGKVYKVRNVISDRVEAMKVLLPDLVAMPELADRFLREIKVLAMLNHPNIAQLHTAVRANNQLLMVMEFVEGETLDHRLRQGALPLPQALDCIAQVLSALDFAHTHGVVHRDIKPANMMLTPSGVVKLMDFGIAKATADNKLTMTGTTMGSVYYMSPEQIQGVATLDGRADLYSVGVTLYELVTGKRPFDGESQYSIMAAHLEKSPVPPIALDPRLPQALNDAILMAVAKDPNARFQTAAAFRNALAGVAAAIQVPYRASGCGRDGSRGGPAVSAAPTSAAHRRAFQEQTLAMDECGRSGGRGGDRLRHRIRALETDSRSRAGGAALHGASAAIAGATRYGHGSQPRAARLRRRPLSPRQLRQQPRHSSPRPPSRPRAVRRMFLRRRRRPGISRSSHRLRSRPSAGVRRHSHSKLRPHRPLPPGQAARRFCRPASTSPNSRCAPVPSATASGI